ncbi:MAG TPA: amidohydrolase family protein, partial [Pyrinomonadaceae bacterium]
MALRTSTQIFLALLLISTTIVLPVNAQTSKNADLILTNGVIWTVDSEKPTAQAVAITDGKFVVVGPNSDVLKTRGPLTQVIDLKGRFVVPGFNDNHVHFASAAQFLEFNIMAVGSQDEFVTRVKDVISRLPKGEWVVGGFWGAYDQWSQGSAGSAQRELFAPDMRRIEEITADYPVFIRKFDDSQFAANRAAIRAAGLDPAKPAAPEVEFLSDANGPTGHMRGKGVLRLFNAVVPRRFSRERRTQQTRNALSEIRKYGVTNVSDMSDDEQLEIYRELHSKGELTVRIHFRPGLDRWPELASKGTRVGTGDDWIRLGALKG